ncbi:hypothetical protein AMTRI_Chr04g251300 [Amborella trichopoda]
MSSPNVWVLIGLGLAGILLMTRRFKKAIKEDFGAFVMRLRLLPPPQPAPPKAPHPLSALSFAVKDIFNVNGYVTGFGSPDWEKTHEPASWTAQAVSAVVEGGATCVGKTVMDELGLSINGDNAHYGTPINPAAPSRIPGGSSSGSAVAVAAELVDFSLGTDTVGDVRIPAAFCSILGFRPSHGTISMVGVIPLAQSLDTVGLFARDPAILRRVGHVLLQLSYTDSRNPRNIVIADDCFQLIKIPANQITQVVTKSAEKLFGRQVLNHVNLGNYMASKVPSLRKLPNKEQRNGEEKSVSLKVLSNAMQFLQRYEFKKNHVEWNKSTKPDLGSGISNHVQAALEMETETEIIGHCQTARNEARSALNALLKDDGILVIPTVPGPPPKLRSKTTLLEDYQSQAFTLLAIASMSGCCQVTIPLGSHDNCPVSVSFIARHGGDRFLLDTVQAMYVTLQEQADIAAKSSLSRVPISKEESAEIAKEKGNIAYKEKQWQKAINLYSEAIKLNGRNATYYSNRAAAYLELTNFVLAEADCTTAIALDKRNVKAYLRRGTARDMLGYYKDALEDFRHALVLEPTNKMATQASNRLKKLFE